MQVRSRNDELTDHLDRGGQDGTTLQPDAGAEFYNLFNHPNLYVNGATADVSAQSFSPRFGQSDVGEPAAVGDFVGSLSRKSSYTVLITDCENRLYRPVNSTL
jgi:hypothetical protein